MDSKTPAKRFGGRAVRVAHLRQGHLSAVRVSEELRRLLVLLFRGFDKISVPARTSVIPDGHC